MNTMNNTVENIYEMSSTFAAKYGILPNAVFLGENQYKEVLNYCDISEEIPLVAEYGSGKGIVATFTGLEIIEVCAVDFLRVGLSE